MEVGASIEARSSSLDSETLVKKKRRKNLMAVIFNVDGVEGGCFDSYFHSWATGKAQQDRAKL